MTRVDDSTSPQRLAALYEDVLRAARKGKRSRAEEHVRKTLIDQVVAAQGYAKGASKGQKKK